MNQAAFGLIGLGTMGENFALNLDDHAVSTALWNRRPEATRALVAAHPERAFVATESLRELVDALEPPRRLMMLIPAGDPVEDMIGRLRPLLEEGDVLIDGGNSDFRDTARREAGLRGAGIHLLGTGVSGGEEGARHGPSLMPGGTQEAWERCREVFEAVAAETESGPCVTRCGPDGAGHFVKMVHNGIEYGIMQLLAETYDLMQRGLGMETGEMADVFASWNEGPLASFLVEITAQILTVTDADGGPLVEKVLDEAGQKGTGRWTVSLAVDEAVPVPTIAAAVDARVLSAFRERRLEIAERADGPEAKLSQDDRNGWLDALRDALHAGMLCSYAQGMELIRTISVQRAWGTDLSEIARIWKGGCIIRAKLLDDLMRAFRDQPAMETLLLDDGVRETLEGLQPGWRRVVAAAASHGVPAPAHAASLAWWDACRTARLPQNLTQAQRDAFGAHTYKRLDDPEGEARHTDWLA